MDKRSFWFVFALAIAFFSINSYFFPAQVPKTPEIVQETIQNNIVAEVSEQVVEPVTEKFYLLENEYQQVVFSNKGGAITEINLPLKTSNPHSTINEIYLDTEIKGKSPENAYFPLNPSESMSEGGEKVVKDPILGGYTPLLRRSLKNGVGKVVFELPERHYAMNLIDSHGKTINYEMTRLGAQEIEFTAEENNRKIVKTFKFNPAAPYAIELSIKTEGDTSDLWLTSGLLEVELISGSYSPVLKYCNGKGWNAKMKKLKLPKTDVTYDNISSTWTSNSNGFFGIITDTVGSPSNRIKIDQLHGTVIPTRLSFIDPINDSFPSKNYPSYEILIPYQAGSQNEEYRIFAGPFDDAILQKVDSSYANSDTNSSSNWGLAVTIQGWFSAISEPFAKFLSFFLNFFYSITHSWGFSIILLTLVLRVILFPLNNWSYKSSMKMQKIAPKQKAIQEKYKKDPQRMRMEMMLLYKNEKVNPLTTFIPFFIQLPFLFGMFDLLKSSFALRGASFIPGWIDNLTAPDVLFSWSTPIIFFGTSFHLLPFITGGLMFLQQRITIAKQNNTGVLNEQQQQMKMMGNIMIPLSILFFYNMPSGLNIYWISSTVFGIFQEWFIRRNNKSKK